MNVCEKSTHFSVGQLGYAVVQLPTATFSSQAFKKGDKWICVVSETNSTAWIRVGPARGGERGRAVPQKAAQINDAGKRDDERQRMSRNLMKAS